MTKENFLFGIIGLLAGFMIGFFFANSVNQSALISPPPQAAQQTSGAGLPSGHPSIPGAPGGGSVPEVSAAIENARQNPNDFEAQMKAAELFYQIQRFEGAIEFLKRANELQPENVEVLVNLANANFDAGKYDEAEKLYGRVIQKRPEDLNVRTDKALTLLFREPPNYDGAIQELKFVLEKDPKHVLALQNLTVAYTKKADKANASATLTRLEQADPSNSAIARLREEIGKIGAG